jgi:hypothetical protein
MVIVGMLACSIAMAWLMAALMDVPLWPLVAFFSFCVLIGVLREKLLIARERDRRQ